MKILHVTEVYGDGAGGSGLTVSSLISLLENKNHKNAVLCGQKEFSNSNRKHEILFLEGVCDFRLKPDQAMLAQVETFVQKVKPDVIQFHQNANPHLINFLSQKYPTVIYIYNHGFTCPSGTRFYARSTEVCPISVSSACLANHYIKRCGSRRLNRIIESYARTKLVYKAVHKLPRIIAISKYVAETLVTAGYDQTKIKVIHSLSPAIMSNRDINIEEYPAKSNLLLYAGRITELKGPHFLIKSLPLLKQNWRLKIVGDGYYLSEVRQLVENLEIGDKVEL